MKGLVKEEQRGTTLFPSSLVASVTSIILVERQKTKNPISSKIYVKERATISPKPLKKKFDVTLINSLETSCHSYKTWDIIIITNAYMVFTLQGIVPEAVYTDAFI